MTQNGVLTRKEKFLARYLPFLILLTLGLLGTWFWETTRERRMLSAQSDFEHHANRTLEALKVRLGSYRRVLLATRGVLAASPDISPGEWKKYGGHLDIRNNYPGIWGVTWAPVASPDNISVRYVTPLDDSTRNIIGYNMQAEPIRSAAMAQARDTGQPVLSPPLHVQAMPEALARSLSLILFVPVYSNSEIPQTVQARREQIIGFVNAGIHIPTMMQSVVNLPEGMRLCLYEGTEVNGDKVLYSSAKHNPDVVPTFSYVKQVDFNGHPFTLKMESGALQVMPQVLGMDLTLFSYWLLAFMLAALIRELVSMQFRAKRLAAKMSARALQSEHEMRLIMDNVPAIITYIDRNNRIAYANRRHADWAQTDLEGIIGKTLDDNFLSSQGDNPHLQAIANAMQGEMQRYEAEILPDRVLDVSIIPNERRGKVDGVFLFASDISETRAMANRMSHLAQYDHLTQLPNRALLQERLQQAMLHGKRDGRYIALMFIDLDNFKNINDSLGHAFGDRLLQKVAKRLRSAVRENDTVSRLGGDEFVILLTGMTCALDASHVALNILSKVARPVYVDGHELHVGASIGISLYPQENTTADDLMKQADTAMYYAKRDGRGCYRFFSEEMSIAADRRLNLERALRAAIGNGELSVYYQPKIRASDNVLIGVEVLARWYLPDGSEVLPAEFIPLAEETGLVRELDAWVLREACYRCKQWHELGWTHLTVAVNISLARLDIESLHCAVQSALKESGLPPDKLEIELIESEMLRNSESNHAWLNKLKELGVKIAIDDFGVGYSNLSYLQNFGFDVLKIDKSFVQALEYSADTYHLIRGIMAMSHALGLQVVAEGVESEYQAAILRNEGCDMLQGYLFYMPMPAGELEDLLKSASGNPNNPEPGTRNIITKLIGIEAGCNRDLPVSGYWA
ncbi:MAG: EAL domain-containing protein [Pseudomonadota bacterium]|nr:EAL domain-containing protein [Pseudomonadota bacterium]